MRRTVRHLRYHAYRTFCKLRYKGFPEVPWAVANKLWAFKPDESHKLGKTAYLNAYAEHIREAGFKVREYRDLPT